METTRAPPLFLTDGLKRLIRHDEEALAKGTVGAVSYIETLRVFLNHKPYWRGLSGDVIALDSAYGDPRNEVSYCSFIKTKNVHNYCIFGY